MVLNIIEAVSHTAIDSSNVEVTRATNPARKLYDKLAVVDDFVRYGIRF